MASWLYVKSNDPKISKTFLMSFSKKLNNLCNSLFQSIKSEEVTDKKVTCF